MSTRRRQNEESNLLTVIRTVSEYPHIVDVNFSVHPRGGSLLEQCLEIYEWQGMRLLLRNYRVSLNPRSDSPFVFQVIDSEADLVALKLLLEERPHLDLDIIAFGYTPLLYAVSQKKTKSVVCLLEHMLKHRGLEYVDKQLNVNQVSENCGGVLHVANSVEMIELLLKAGADPNKGRKRDGSVALCSSLNDHAFRALLEVTWLTNAAKTADFLIHRFRSEFDKVLLYCTLLSARQISRVGRRSMMKKLPLELIKKLIIEYLK